MLIDAAESQVIFIDLQEKLISRVHESQFVFENVVLLAEAAKMLDIPLWGTEQEPGYWGHTPSVLQKKYQKTLVKMQFSAVEEGLAEWLRPSNPQKTAIGNARSLPKHLQKNQQKEILRESIIIVGCDAHTSVLQTALHLVEEEFQVWVVTDACSSGTERNRDAAFDRLAAAGVDLVTTEMVLHEWLRSAEHPAYPSLLKQT